MRVFGRWNLTGSGAESSGALVYKLEHRHSYGDPAPSDFYLGNVGYVGLDDQYTFEAFYRWQLTRKFALTLDYLYLQDPTLNTDEDSSHVLSLRGRFAL